MKELNKTFIVVGKGTQTIKTENSIAYILKPEQQQIISQFKQEVTLAYFTVEIQFGGYYDQLAIGVTSNPEFQ